MPLTELLFSFKGRLNRMPWWVASIVTAVVAGALSALLEVAAEATGHVEVDPETNTTEPTGLYGVALLAVSVVDFWIVLALSVKRLHDRDRTGWWLLVQVLILFAAIGLVAAAFLVHPDSLPLTVLAVLVGIAAIVISAWIFVEMGFLRGTDGPNRFGADPLAAKKADAAL